MMLKISSANEGRNNNNESMSIKTKVFSFNFKWFSHVEIKCFLEGTEC